jgi:hypothetical protein
LEVNVRGSSAGAFTSRTSTDTSPREPVDAASMIDELPGVHVRRLGAEGAFASISVRGSAPSQVGVVLGAIPLTSAADPAFDVGSLPLWPGAAFRVYRGFAPASLGTTGYLGGVLAVDPPSPAIGGRTAWWTGVGSFGALKLRLGDLRRVNGVELGSGVYASRSDGDFPYFHQDQLGVGPLREQRRLNAKQVAVGAIERVAVERSWGTVSALILADARRAGVPGDFGDPVRFASLATSRILAGLDASLRTGEAGAAHLAGWARRETSDLDDPHGEQSLISGVHATTTKSAVEAAGLSAGWRGRVAGKLTLAAILDARVERFQPLSAQGFQASAPASRLAGGIGLDVEWRPLPALTAIISARLDARRDEGSGFVSARAPADAITSSVLPTGHLGGSLRLHDAAVLSAHVGALARPPSFVELYGNGVSLVAAPGLGPEHAISADLGLAGDALVGGAQLGYELVGFVSDARQLIAFQPLGPTTFQAHNVDHALLGGGEIMTSLAARGLRTQLSYTLLLSRDQEGNPLPGRPLHDLAYDATYAVGPARLRYGVDLASGVNAAVKLLLPPRISHSIGASLDLPFVPGLRAAVEVQNLFDQRILWIPSPSAGHIPYPLVDFLRYPLPGRTVWATLSFTRPNASR